VPVHRSQLTSFGRLPFPQLRDGPASARHTKVRVRLGLVNSFRLADQIAPDPDVVLRPRSLRPSPLVGSILPSGPGATFCRQAGGRIRSKLIRVLGYDLSDEASGLRKAWKTVFAAPAATPALR
jgi:hypothetical protein